MKKRLIHSVVSILRFCCLLLVLSNNYAHAKVIYHNKNEFGPLWVHENNQVRALSFVADSSIYQSMINLDQPDIIQLEYIKFLLSSLYIGKAPKHILLIGLGGGTAAKAINTILPQAELDIVEINPLIPPVAQNFFLFKPNNNTHITVGDGYLFTLNSSASKYDLILVDVFDKDYIPAPFLTEIFVNNVKRILTSQGVVAINTFEGGKFFKIESELFKDAFKNFLELTNGSSRIIIAKNGRLPSLSQIKENAKGWNFNLNQVGIDAESLANRFNFIK